MNKAVIGICLALAASALCRGNPPAEPTADAGITIKARQSMVELVLSVKDGGRYIDKLTDKDFSITVDGAPQ